MSPLTAGNSPRQRSRPRATSRASFTAHATGSIQNTQNSHTTALQIKLDEVIRAIDGAKDELIDLEDMSEAELERLQKRFRALGERARNGKMPTPRAAGRGSERKARRRLIKRQPSAEAPD